MRGGIRGIVVTISSPLCGPKRHTRTAAVKYYGLVVLPDEDRIVSTNSSMHDPDLFSGVTYQIWRLSDLKLLKTANFAVGNNLYSHISPEEPRRAPDGSIFASS